MNIAFVRTSSTLDDGEKSHRLVGLYFYGDLQELFDAVDETLEPERCEFLELDVSSGGILFNKDYKGSVEERFIDYFDISKSTDTEDIPVNPLYDLTYAGQSEVFTKAVIDALTGEDGKIGWQQIVSEEKD